MVDRLFLLSGAFAILLPLRAMAADPQSVALAAGIKTGVIPPLLFAPEVVLHLPQAFVGGFFMLANGASARLALRPGGGFLHGGIPTQIPQRDGVRW